LIVSLQQGETKSTFKKTNPIEPMKHILYIILSFAIATQLNAQLVVSGEYFIDTEPGIGFGIPLEIAVPADSIEHNFSIIYNDLTPGFHHLGLRFKNDFGNWSSNDMRNFYVMQNEALDGNIVLGEYFVDIEPGIGNGTSFSIPNPSDSLENDISLLLPEMELGNHILYIRYKDAADNWTLAEPRPFLVCTNYAAIADFSFNVTDDLAFFSDHSQYIDSLQWDFGDGSPISNQLNEIHLYETGGQYNVTQLCYNICGNDTITKTIDVNGAGTFTPKFSANNNYIVATITGAGFTENTQVKLIREGEELIPASIQWNNSHHMTATFNFVNETLGIWDLAIDVPGEFLDTLHDAITLEPVGPVNLSTYIVAPSRQLINRYQKILVNISNDGNQTVFGLQNFVKFSKQSVSAVLLSEIKAPSFSDHYLDSINHGLITSLDPLTQDSVYFGHYIIPMLGPGETATLMFSVIASSIQPMSMQSVLGNSIFSNSQITSLLSGITSFTPQGITAMAGRSNLAIGGLLPNQAITGLIGSLINGTAGQTNYNSPSYPSANLTIGVSQNNNVGSPPSGCVGCGNQGVAPNTGGASPISGGQQVGAGITSPIIPNAPLNPFQPFVPDPADEEWSQDILDQITDLLDDELEDELGDDVGEDAEDNDEEPLDPDQPAGSDCGADVPVAECPELVPIDWDADGEPDNEGDEKDDDELRFVTGFDPNAIYGPDGFTDQHYVRQNTRMDYRVTFENVDTASANVVEVMVNTLIDTSLFDLSTFRYEAFGIGEQIYALSPYRSSFVSEVDQSLFENCLLRITGNAPDSTGNIHVYYESLNLETRALIDNPDDGFLPPNVDAPFGEAYFVFSVMQKENLNHLTEFPMEAEIVFDQNAPIITEIYNNIIDAEAPESFISNTPSVVTESSLVLHFNKQDSHSGVAFVDVYVSADGSTFERKVRTNSDSLVVNLTYGVEYRFYTIATDFCGNKELAPLSPDVTVSYLVGLDELSDVRDIRIFPVPATDKLNVTFTLVQSGDLTLKVMDTSGKVVLNKEVKDKKSGTYNIDLNIDRLSQGVYSLQLLFNGGAITQRIIKD
jgi:PKD repeat protein